MLVLYLLELHSFPIESVIAENSHDYTLERATIKLKDDVERTVFQKWTSAAPGYI